MSEVNKMENKNLSPQNTEEKTQSFNPPEDSANDNLTATAVYTPTEPAENDPFADAIIDENYTREFEPAADAKSTEPTKPIETVNSANSDSNVNSENSPKHAKPASPAKKKTGRKKKKIRRRSAVNTSIFGGIIMVVIILGCSLGIAVTGIKMGMEYLGINKNDSDVTFNIPDGSTPQDIAQILKDNGVINNPDMFMLICKLKKADTMFPGDITLSPATTYADMIDELCVQRQSFETVQITFPEGITLPEAAQLLEENNVCSAEDFLFEFNKNQGYDFESEVPQDDNRFYEMEGYFYPETYEFYINDTAYSVTRTIREQFEKIVATDEMKKKIKDSGMSMDEVIILASIVQKEAGFIEDMPEVASVFINRLAKSDDEFPHLQSDATKAYVRDTIVPNLTTSLDVDRYSEAYDTYQCFGLPKGPVCNPGLDAIMGVLNAPKTDYYYFCNNLETKVCLYASTYEEHQENLKKAGLSEEGVGANAENGENTDNPENADNGENPEENNNEQGGENNE